MDHRVSSVFPLAERSRARRRLLLRGYGASSQQPANDLTEESDPLLRVVFDDSRNIHLEIGTDDPAGPLTNREAIQRLLMEMQPVTWLFTGDNLTRESAKVQGWRTFPEHVGERIHSRLGRILDVVIDTTVRHSKVNKLLQTFDWRVTRFQPEVVSLMVGMADANSGPGGREKFGEDLTRIVDDIKSQGAVVVLNTPPYVPGDRQGVPTDLPAYVEIIQSIAESTNALLIDHWSHWAATQEASEEFGKRYLDDEVYPSSIGHVELARHTFREMSLVEPLSSDQVVREPS